jgi:hypothetical protein
VASTGSGFFGASLEFLEAGAAAAEAAGAGTTGAEFLEGTEFGLLDATVEAEGSDGAAEPEAGAATVEEGTLADRTAAVAGEAGWFCRKYQPPPAARSKPAAASPK